MDNWSPTVVILIPNIKLSAQGAELFPSVNLETLSWRFSSNVSRSPATRVRRSGVQVDSRTHFSYFPAPFLNEDSLVLRLLSTRLSPFPSVFIKRQPWQPGPGLGRAERIALKRLLTFSKRRLPRRTPQTLINWRKRSPSPVKNRASPPAFHFDSRRFCREAMDDKEMEGGVRGRNVISGWMKTLSGVPFPIVIENTNNLPGKPARRRGLLTTMIFQD